MEPPIQNPFSRCYVGVIDRVLLTIYVLANPRTQALVDEGTIITTIKQENQKIETSDAAIFLRFRLV